MADDIGLTIDGKEWVKWSEISIRSAVDAVSEITLTAPFEPERSEFRSTFVPLSYKPISVTVDGATLFTGTMVGVDPRVTADERSVVVTGYSTPGVLNDCPAPGSSVPLEFRKVGLKQIVAQLADIYGLEYVFDQDEGARFDKVALDVDKKIFTFLTELAQQRNLVVSNTSDGKLLIWRSAEPGRPVARLRDDASPAVRITPRFSPQDYFSQYTGFGRTKRRKLNGKHTELNRFLPSVLRPNCFKIDDADAGDVPAATRAKLGRMFANVASYTVEDIPGWRDPEDFIWDRNTTVTLNAQSAMCYRESEFLVRAVNLNATARSRTSALELVLPGAFSGEQPEQLPWVE